MDINFAEISRDLYNTDQINVVIGDKTVIMLANSFLSDYTGDHYDFAGEELWSGWGYMFLNYHNGEFDNDGLVMPYHHARIVDSSELIEQLSDSFVVLFKSSVIEHDNTDKYEKLIRLGNKAKDVQQYGLSNACWAVLADFWQTSNYDDKQNKTGLRFEYETDEPDGILYPQVYYDLIRIIYKDESLCIPVPLVGYMFSMMVLKQGNKIERLNHDRHTSRPESSAQVLDLWKELFEIVKPADVISAVEEFLHEYDDDNQSLIKFIRFMDGEDD